MIKYLLIVLALICADDTFAQSKKKQIEMLQRQVDSLNVAQEQSSAQFEALRKENVILRKIMIGYVHQIDTLMQVNLDLIEKLEDAKVNRTNKENLEKASMSIKSTILHRSINYIDTLSKKEDGEKFYEKTSKEQIEFGRKRINSIEVRNAHVEVETRIRYKFTVDASGRIVDFSVIQSSTTDNESLFNEIGNEIMKQVKYEPDYGSPLITEYHTVRLKAY